MRYPPGIGWICYLWGEPAQKKSKESIQNRTEADPHVAGYRSKTNEFIVKFKDMDTATPSNRRPTRIRCPGQVTTDSISSNAVMKIPEPNLLFPLPSFSICPWRIVHLFDQIAERLLIDFINPSRSRKDNFLTVATTDRPVEERVLLPDGKQVAQIAKLLHLRQRRDTEYIATRVTI